MIEGYSNSAGRSKKQILLGVIAFVGISTIGALVATLATGGSDAGTSSGTTAAQNNADKVIPDGTGTESPQGQLGEPSPQEKIEWHLPYSDVPLLVKYEGELVEFVFESEQVHDLAVVNTAEEYANCDLTNAITICPQGTLETAGRCAFSVPRRTLLMVCTVASHCERGQKMIIQGIERPDEDVLTPVNGTNSTNATHDNTTMTSEVPTLSPSMMPTLSPIAIVGEGGNTPSSEPPTTISIDTPSATNPPSETVGATGVPSASPSYSPSAAPVENDSSDTVSPSISPSLSPVQTVTEPPSNLTPGATPSTPPAVAPSKANGGWSAK